MQVGECGLAGDGDGNLEERSIDVHCVLTAFAAKQPRQAANARTNEAPSEECTPRQSTHQASSNDPDPTRYSHAMALNLALDWYHISTVGIRVSQT